jgi:hypothetical protein
MLTSIRGIQPPYLSGFPRSVPILPILLLSYLTCLLR